MPGRLYDERSVGGLDAGVEEEAAAAGRAAAKYIAEDETQAEGKTINAMPAQRSEFLAKLRERAMLNTGLKKTEATEKVTEIEKKEE